MRRDPTTLALMFGRLFRALLVVVAGALLAAGCDSEIERKYQTPLDRLSVENANWYVVFPSLTRVQDEFLSLIVNMEGLQGLLDLIQAYSGIDLGQEDLIVSAGMAGDFAPLVYERNGSLVMALGVTNRRSFENFMGVLAKQGGYETRNIRTEGPVIHEIGERFAWTLDSNLALFILSSKGKASANLASLLLEAPPESPGQVDGEKIRFAVKIASGGLERRNLELLQQLGAASGLGHVILRFLDSCSSIEGSVAPGDRYRIEATAAGCRLPVSGTQTLGSEALLPDDSILLLQMAFDSSTLFELLSPAQAMILEQLYKGYIKSAAVAADKEPILPNAAKPPVARLASEAPREPAGEGNEVVPGGARTDVEAEAQPVFYESLQEFLGQFKGEVAISLLGIAPSASFETFTSPKDAAEPIFALHAQLMLPLKPNANLAPLFDSRLMAGLLPDFEPADIGGGDLVAWEYCLKEKERPDCFSLVRNGDALIVVTGSGEGVRLVRTLRGQQKSLKDSLFVTLLDGSMTATLKSRRLVRDLMNKGFPPYFMAMLSSILEVRLATVAADGGTQVKLEIVLR